MKKLKFILTGLLISTSLFISAQTTIVDSIISGGIFRSYRLYIPAAYNGSSPRPLVFNLHGYTSNALEQQYYSNFMPIADTANFLVVYPQGTFIGTAPYWNAGLSNSGVNDIQFISDLITVLENNYSIDVNSIYSCGFSNGGFMSNTLACTLNNKIAAIASVSGSIFNTQYTTCSPNRVVPVMLISGTADAIVPFSGNGTTMIPMDTALRFWVMNDNCNLIPQFTNVPDFNITDGCTAEHYVYNGGTAGSTCELYKIIGGGHAWPGSSIIVGVTNQDFNASLQIWLFFRKYKLSQFVGIEELKQVTDINIYPNPCTNILNIETQNISSTIIMDLNGRRILETTKKQIDVSSLAQGVYSIVFISGNFRSVKKLVKI